jgi:hypothetical protein
MTFGEYLAAASKRSITLRDSERVGQAYMNALMINARRKDLNGWLTGSPIDPFYLDSNLGAALDFLAEKW